MNSIIDNLTQLGLTANQAKVYNCLLRQGSSYPTTIAHITRLTRTTCYRILDSLNQQGLVLKFRKGKKFYYEAAHPKHIKMLLREKQRTITNQLATLDEQLPNLKSLFYQNESLYNIEFFEGKEKFLDLMEDAFQFPGESIYNFGNVKSVLETFAQQPTIIEKYIYKRVQAEMKNYSLVPKEQFEYVKKWLRHGYDNVSKTYQSRYRYYDDETLNYSIHMRLYHNRIAFLDFESTKPTGIIIANQPLYEMLFGIFKALWKKAKPIK